MNKDKVIAISGTEETKDLLTDMAKEGARRMLQVALEEEVVEFIKLHSGEQLADGRQRVVRNGHLPTPGNPDRHRKCDSASTANPRSGRRQREVCQQDPAAVPAPGEER